MPTTRTPRPARFRKRIRRVRLEKTWWPRKRLSGTVILESSEGRIRRGRFAAAAGFFNSTSSTIWIAA
jgi:hypothetical protein